MFSNVLQLLNKKFSILILLPGTIVMIFIMVMTGKPLNTRETPCGILNLELASTKHQVQLVIASWRKKSSINNDFVQAAKINTWFDFAFLFFYSLLLFAFCSSLSRLVANKLMASVLSFFAAVALVAGGLDIVENIGMLLSLSGIITQSITLITFLASIIKWALVLGVMASLLIGVVVFLFSRNRKDKGYK